MHVCLWRDAYNGTRKEMKCNVGGISTDCIAFDFISGDATVVKWNTTEQNGIEEEGEELPFINYQ